MNYIIKNDVTFTFYQYDRIEKSFVNLVYDIIRRYPFRFHFFMTKVIQRPEVTYIKDTTMIIGLNLFLKNEQQMIFEILRLFVKSKAVVKVIDKKEFLIVHLHSPKISEFFVYPNRWLSYLLYHLYCDLYGDHDCHLGVIVSEPNKERTIGEIFIERLGKQFIVFTHGFQKRLTNNQFIRPIYLYATFTKAIDIKEEPTGFDCLRYSFHPGDFQRNVKNYFDNPCNFLTNIV